MGKNDALRTQTERIKAIVISITIDKDGLTNQLILHLTGGFKPVIQTIHHPLSEIRDDNLSNSMDFEDVLCHMNVGDKVELMFNGRDYSVTFLR